MLRIILWALFFVPSLYAAEHLPVYDIDKTSQLFQIVRFIDLEHYPFSFYQEEVKKLVKAGAYPNIVTEGKSLLTWVVKTDDEELTRCLLAHKADPNPRQGVPPLFKASRVSIKNIYLRENRRLK